MTLQTRDAKLTVLLMMGINPDKHGSFEDFAVAISRELTSRGHRSFLAFPMQPPKWLRNKIENAGGELAPTKILTRSWGPGGLGAFLRQRDISILHLNLMNTLIAWNWKRRTKKPLIISMRVADSYRNKSLRGRLAAWRARLLYQSAVVIGVSDYMREFALKLDFGLDPQRVIRIHNGIDIDRFKPNPARSRIRHELGWKENEIIILSVSHLRREKGLDLLIQSFANLVQARSNIRLVVVGGGPELKSLQRLAEQLRVVDKIEWLGVRDDTKCFFTSADIFVLTPTWEEAFGNVFAEASSCALPVIASCSGGIPEIIEHRETGIIVDKNDVKGLSVAIGELVDNHDLRQQMGEAGHKRIEKYFSNKLQARLIVDLYEREGGG